MRTESRRKFAWRICGGRNAASFVLGGFILTGSLDGGAKTNGVEFRVDPAQARWMPGKTAIRWGADRLESLYFVTVESELAVPNLSLRITVAGETMTHEMKTISPLTEARKRQIRQEVPRWLTPSAYDPREADLRNHESATQRSVSEFWLPVTPGEDLVFALHRDNELLKMLRHRVELDGDLWWQMRIESRRPLDPLDFGYAFLPKDRLLVASGDLVRISCPLVGLNRDISSVQASVLVSNKADPGNVRVRINEKIAVEYLQRGNWEQSFSTQGWPAGRYIVQAVITGPNRNNLGMWDREIILVEAKPIRHRFGAFYQDLKYDNPVVVEEWDALGENRLAKGKARWEDLKPHFGPLQDIVVGFENLPYKFVFWRGASYVPMWVLNDVWSSWEFLETSGLRRPGYRGAVEPIMDREARFGRVRVIASHPARAVVHWRYPQSTRDYVIIDNEWVDEYYFIYPDLVAVRKAMGWFLKGSWHEVNEFITLIPPGMHPREALEYPETLTMLNLEGKSLSLRYPNPWKDWDARWNRFSRGQSSFMFKTHLKDRPDAFVSIREFLRIYSLWNGGHRAHGGDQEARRRVGDLEIPYVGDWHWPMQRIKGSLVVDPMEFAEHPTHWCLFDLEHLPAETRDLGDDHELKVWVHLTGLETAVDGLEMTRSWLSPADIKTVSGLKFREFDPAQRAYLFDLTGQEKEWAFVLRPQDKYPQVNPVFIVDRVEEEHPLEITWDGQSLPADSYRSGYELQPDGFYRLVIWTQRRFETQGHLSIHLKGP